MRLRESFFCGPTCSRESKVLPWGLLWRGGAPRTSRPAVRSRGTHDPTKQTFEPVAGARCRACRCQRAFGLSAASGVSHLSSDGANYTIFLSSRATATGPNRAYETALATRHVRRLELLRDPVSVQLPGRVRLSSADRSRIAWRISRPSSKVSPSANSPTRYATPGAVARAPPGPCGRRGRTRRRTAGRACPAPRGTTGSPPP